MKQKKSLLGAYWGARRGNDRMGRNLVADRNRAKVWSDRDSREGTTPKEVSQRANARANGGVFCS